MEISQDNIASAPLELKEKLANDICRLLQVREKNVEMSKDWLLFLTTSDFKITPGEIYLAFRQALAKQLKDENGQEIEVLPELSNNTTGKVIAAYLREKAQNQAYLNSKSELKLALAPKKEVSIDEKRKIREEFIVTIYEEFQKSDTIDSAWLLYDELLTKGYISITDDEKRNLYKEQERLYLATLQSNAKSAGKFSQQFTDYKSVLNSVNLNQKNGHIVNRCKAIIVSRFLSQYKDDFKKFKILLAYDNNV